MRYNAQKVNDFTKLVLSQRRSPFGFWGARQGGQTERERVGGIFLLLHCSKFQCSGGGLSRGTTTTMAQTMSNVVCTVSKGAVGG